MNTNIDTTDVIRSHLPFSVLDAMRGSELIGHEYKDRKFGRVRIAALDWSPFARSKDSRPLADLVKLDD